MLSDLRVGIALGLGEGPGNVGGDIVDLLLVRGEQEACEDRRRGIDGEGFRLLGPRGRIGIECTDRERRRGIRRRMRKAVGCCGDHGGDTVDFGLVNGSEKSRCRGRRGRNCHGAFGVGPCAIFILLGGVIPEEGLDVRSGHGVDRRHDLSAEGLLHLRKVVDGGLVGRREHSGRGLRCGRYARGFRVGHVEPRAVGIVPVVARDVQGHALGVGDVRDIIYVRDDTRRAPVLLGRHRSGLLRRRGGDNGRNLGVLPLLALPVV